MRFGAVLAVLFFVFALPLPAQQKEKSFEVSPFFGYLYGGTVSDLRFDLPIGLPPANKRYDLADHATYGLRVGYNLGPHLEPEIQWSHTETFLRSTGSLPVPDLCLDRGCFKVDYFLGGMTYNFAKGRTRPYASLSVGVARFSPTFHGLVEGDPEHPALTSSTTGSDTRFTGSLGLGVKSFITPSFGVRLDVHGYASRIANIRFNICTINSTSGPGGPVIPVTTTCGTKEWLLNGEVSGGLLFAF
jgi:hypothetical protein